MPFSIDLTKESIVSLFACECQDCSSENIRFDYSYNTICSGPRQMLLWATVLSRDSF